MHVGMAAMFQRSDTGPTDQEFCARDLAMVDEAEDRGFDSVWAPEHHFTDYVMSPNPSQFLTWVAARTSRVRLGTMVLVLPWHQPARVAEEISVLDTFSGGRVLLGVGRGLGPVEFDGFGVDMGSSRERFREAAEIIVGAFDSGVLCYDGEMYTQPQMKLRPAPMASLRGRVYASSISPESIDIVCKLGFGIMVIAQKPWQTIVDEIGAYTEKFVEINGCKPPRPLIVNFTILHEDPERARELHEKYTLAYNRSAVAHYEFDNPRLASIPGYEYYARLKGKIDKVGIDEFARFLSNMQTFGTPEAVTEELVRRVREIDGAGVISAFNFGGMPIDVARHSFDLFTDQVLPKLKAADPYRDAGPRTE